MNRQSWTAEEDQAITKLVEQLGIEDWKKIAFKLGDYLGRQRTGKQCRERWYNHLSPTVSKNPWSQQEEQLLFIYHKDFGNRWKYISKMFIGRTDNDIKNHFYSTLRRSLRRLNKIVGQKNSTTQMREIKPSVLSTIMHYIYQQEQNAQNQLIESLKDLPLLILEFASFKPIKFNIKSTNIEQIREKTNQIFSLITLFNEDYQKNKAFRRNQKTEKMRMKSSLSESSMDRESPEIKIEEHSHSYKQFQVQEHFHKHLNPRKGSGLKIEVQDYFHKNDDAKMLNKTEFSLEPDHAEGDNHQNITNLTIFHQFSTSPKQAIKQPQLHPHITTFSLQADEISYLHFNEPEEPSRINIDQQEYMRLNHQIQAQKNGYHSPELIDEIIETHFA